MRLHPKNDLILLFLLLPLFSCAANDNTSLLQKQRQLTKDAVVQDNTASTTLCGDSEISYFSCTTKSSKKISMCGDHPGSGSENLIYRFGRNNQIELEYSASLSSPPGIGSGFLKNSYSRHLVDYTEISFQNADHEYRIFRRLSDEPSNKGISQITTKEYGVEVSLVSTGAGVSSVACERVDVDALKELSRLLKCDRSSALGCSE